MSGDRGGKENLSKEVTFEYNPKVAEEVPG